MKEELAWIKLVLEAVNVRMSVLRQPVTTGSYESDDEKRLVEFLLSMNSKQADLCNASIGMCQKLVEISDAVDGCDLPSDVPVSAELSDMMAMCQKYLQESNELMARVRTYFPELTAKKEGDAMP